jgi:hypothetical protein
MYDGTRYNTLDAFKKQLRAAQHLIFRSLRPRLETTEPSLESRRHIFMFLTRSAANLIVLLDVIIETNLMITCHAKSTETTTYAA